MLTPLLIAICFISKQFFVTVANRSVCGLQGKALREGLATGSQHAFCPAAMRLALGRIFHVMPVANRYPRATPARRSRSPKTLIYSPPMISTAPASCRRLSRSPSSSAALAMPNTGTSRESGATRQVS